MSSQKSNRGITDSLIWKLFFIILAVGMVIYYFLPIKHHLPHPHYPAKPTYHKAADAKQRKFIRFLLAKVQATNAAVLEKRQQLDLLYHNWHSKKKLTTQQTQWLYSLAKDYQLTHPSFQKLSTWNELLERVDIVPVSLVIAQAIIESSWGHSRFAQEANNYFGQHCSVPGCGVVPKQRPVNDHSEVKRYPNALASVQGYIYNLNTNAAYKDLRTVRMQVRKKGEPVNGADLSAGLESYSQRGAKYVDNLQQLIKQFNLQKYD